jgi:hypothetical protein
MAIGDAEFSAIQCMQFRVSREYFAILLKEEPAVLDVEGAALHLLVSISGMAVEAAFDPDDWPAERQRLHLKETIEMVVCRR